MAAAEASAVRVLVVGEAWIKHTVHMKGFDHFQTTEYEAGDAVLVAGPAESGFNVTYLRAREISGRFPTTAEALGRTTSSAQRYRRQLLKRKSASTIGLVVPDLANPFFALLTVGVERAVAARDVVLCAPEATGHVSPGSGLSSAGSREPGCCLCCPSSVRSSPKD